jgi:hypothetical protein
MTREADRNAARAANLQAFGITATLTTDEAAAALNRRPGTLRGWASLNTGPIKPIRVHGRLAWRVADVQALLDGTALV